MNCEEIEVENEIEKLNQEIQEIMNAIDELGKVKQQSELKLKEELKKANELHKLKTQKIDRCNSKTNDLLHSLEKLHKGMFELHNNNDIMEKSKNIIEQYKNEFDGLIKLQEDINAIDKNNKPTRKYSCFCQIGNYEKLHGEQQYNNSSFKQNCCNCCVIKC